MDDNIIWFITSEWRYDVVIQLLACYTAELMKISFDISKI